MATMPRALYRSLGAQEIEPGVIYTSDIDQVYRDAADAYPGMSEQDGAWPLRSASRLAIDGP